MKKYLLGLLMVLTIGLVMGIFISIERTQANPGCDTAAGYCDSDIASTTTGGKQLDYLTCDIPSTIYLNATSSVTATAHYTDGIIVVTTNANTTWTSSNYSKISVAPKGQIKGISTGSADIYATYTEGGVSKSCPSTTVTVNIIPPTHTLTSLTCEVPSIIYLNATSSVTATAHYTDGIIVVTTNANTTWTSTEPSVVGVPPQDPAVPKGQIKGNSTGSADIYATYTEGGVSKRCPSTTVTVTVPLVTSLSCSPSSIALAPRGQAQATATYSDGTNSTNVTTQASWSSGDTQCVWVNQTGEYGGRITASAQTSDPNFVQCSTKITAFYNSKSADCTAEVTRADFIAINSPGNNDCIQRSTSSTTISGNSSFGGKDAEAHIRIDGTNLDKTSIEDNGNWSSNAWITKNYSLGPHTIFVAATSDATDTITVNLKDSCVVPPVLTRVDCSPSSISLAPGGLQQATANAVYSNGSRVNVTTNASTTWGSVDPSCASVNNSGQKGLVTAASNIVSCSTNVRATYSGLSGICSVAVSSGSHLDCISGVCLSVAGLGSNTCSPENSVCGSHLECVGLTCQNVSGAGIDRCSAISDCSRLVCVDSSCQRVSGGGSNECSTSASCIHLTRVSVSLNHPSISVGGTSQATAEAIYSDNSRTDITNNSATTWSSSDESIGSMHHSPIIILGKKPGTATITAAFQGVNGSANLSVSCPSGQFSATTICERGKCISTEVYCTSTPACSKNSDCFKKGEKETNP